MNKTDWLIFSSTVLIANQQVAYHSENHYIVIFSNLNGMIACVAMFVIIIKMINSK